MFFWFHITKQPLFLLAILGFEDVVVKKEGAHGGNNLDSGLWKRRHSPLALAPSALASLE